MVCWWRWKWIPGTNSGSPNRGGYGGGSIGVWNNGNQYSVAGESATGGGGGGGTGSNSSGPLLSMVRMVVLESLSSVMKFQNPLELQEQLVVLSVSMVERLFIHLQRVEHLPQINL